MTSMAGFALLAAIPFLIVAAVALGLFFGGRGRIFGPINDVTTAVVLFLLVPAALAVRDLAASSVGAWFDVLCLLAVFGMIVAGVGQLLLVAGRISLSASFATGGVGFVPIVAWIAGLGIVGLGTGALSGAVGWWSVAVIVTIAAAVGVGLLIRADPVRLTLALETPLVIVLIGWMVALASDLLGRA